MQRVGLDRIRLSVVNPPRSLVSERPPPPSISALNTLASDLMTPHGRENPLRSATRAGRPTDTRQFARLEGPKTRVGPYEVVASIPSQSGLEIFAAHKLSPLGFVRRALLKRVRRDGPGFVEGRRRLFEEAQAIAFLEHPGVAALVDLGEDDRGIYMARELVDGVDLLHVTATLRSQTLSKDYVEFLRDESALNATPTENQMCNRSFTFGPANKSRSLFMYDLWTANGRNIPEPMRNASASTPP